MHKTKPKLAHPDVLDDDAFLELELGPTPELPEIDLTWSPELIPFEIDLPPLPEYLIGCASTKYREPASTPTRPALSGGSSRRRVSLTIRVPLDVIEAFKRLAAAEGARYQTVMNRALREFVEDRRE